jgi:acyl carrier protein
MNELATQLRQYIDQNFLFGVSTTYSDDDSFMDNSIIDSTGVLELIAHLESNYGLKVRDEDLVPENLDSINGLVRFVVRKQTNQPVAAAN